ncbi:alpha/beta hydrolase fold domain-containing protein [uncultured Microbacterium sp.]|uniref:alpha/beta hydrolase fold domain-containing protein n=1 Tax=uncultured Microbacterium sp. TaxID=191216 RepID=UPI0026131AC9|nr:alpha/beta hydrolase fold domain-containing protein [uncultured Microbacterium sp.]
MSKPLHTSTTPNLSDAPRPRIAAPLIDGWRTIADALPAAVTTREEMLVYRATAVERSTTLEAIRQAHNLVTEDLSPDVTVFRSPGVESRLRVVFFHGGGLIAGSRLDGADVLARHAAALQLEVWSAEYPLVPETPHDRIVEHLVGVVEQAAVDGLPVVIAGQSAGGGLAASVALECRDRGIPFAGSLLICPMLDRRDTVSAAQFAEDPSWSRASNESCWGAALSGSASTPPGERTDLHGLPPTFLDVGSAEIFRDSVTGFAGALWAAGNQAELHVWSGAFHASDCVVEDAVVSEEAHRAHERWLRRLIDDAL